ncbi:MAG: hypothetical protein NDJ24_08020, partial [Alphaproteobacteria bacterium]|nr:hypothetical protein [Alphaproteobacteria bacterium]
FADQAGNPADEPSKEPAPREETSEVPFHVTLLAHMEAQNPNIIQYFRESMQELLRDMNLDISLTSQSGIINGIKLDKGEPVIVENSTFAFWMYVEPPLWDAVMQSYEEHIWTYDSDRFTMLCESVSADALDHFLEHGHHKEPEKIRAAFEEDYKNQMKPLSLLSAMIGQHMPGVAIRTAIHHGPDFVTPVITLATKDQRDLREHVRAFLEKTPAGTRPLLKPV